jgi:MmyB-like transcription regulator ligand binding domain
MGPSAPPLRHRPRRPTSAPRHRRTKSSGVTDGIQQILDAVTDAPAWVRNPRHDMLAANRVARGLYAPVVADSPPARRQRALCLPGSAARDFFADWERAADDIATMLRSEAGSNPRDKQPIELIGELSAQSEEFRTPWAAHNVRFHRAGRKVIQHPVVGIVDLSFEAMEFVAG